MRKLSFIAVLTFAASALADNCILDPIDFYVDTDSVTNVYLNGAAPHQGILPSTNVVFDAYLTPSVYDEGLCPDVSAVTGAKFALYFGMEGTATNLYVIAAGALNDTLNGFSPTNYCLNVTNESFLGDGECRVTVYALRSVSTYEDGPGASNPGYCMMGFVVFVDGEPVACRDEDYAEKLPELPYYDEWNDTAKALVKNRYLFPSLVPAGVDDCSSKLREIDFVGTGEVKGLSAGHAPFAAASFADITGLAVTPEPEPAQEWTAGGEPKEYASEADAQAAVDDANAKGITVAWPTDAGDAPVGWTGGDGQTRYSALFTLSADGKVVSVVLRAADDPAVEAVETSLTEATKDIDLSGEATSVKVDAIPGLYYGVSAGEGLDSMSVDKWTIATGDKVEVEIPERGDKEFGFYRLEASPAK